MDKIAALSQILELDPANSFARYGLAMEYLSQGRTDAALAEFARTLEHNADYVPAYQMSAQTLIKTGRGEEAATLLRQGLAAAVRTGNGHAASELEQMMNEIA